MNRSEIYIVSATVGFSFILIFSTFLKRSGMSSFEQLFFRLAFSLLFLLLLTYRGGLRFAQRKSVRYFASIGFTYAFFALCGLSAIAFGIPIAVSVALVYTQPIFTALISFATHKERVTLFKAIVVVLGVAGGFLVSGLSFASPQLSLGIAFPVLAGFLYAVYLWLKRQAPVDEYTPFQVLFNTFLFALPALSVAWLILAGFVVEPLFVGFITPDLPQLVLLFFFALCCTVLPYGLLNYVKVGEVPATTEGMLLLGDPLLHALWAMLFFGEFISAIQYVGAGLILISAAINLRVSGKAHA